jgi:hypothetical protein
MLNHEGDGFPHRHRFPPLEPEKPRLCTPVRSDRGFFMCGPPLKRPRPISPVLKMARAAEVRAQLPTSERIRSITKAANRRRPSRCAQKRGLMGVHDR